MFKQWNVNGTRYVMEGRQVQCTGTFTPLKVTGTRFPAILAADRFKTRFEAWCELTRIVKSRFTETPQIRAGRIIEEKLIQTLKAEFPYLGIRAADECPEFTGNPYDYFPNNPVFGGKWDCIGENTMVEIKTTSERNTRFWLQNVPEQYMLQTALYAYLARCDRFIIACSFLPEEAYADPECFQPVLADCVGDGNSICREFSLRETFPDFAENQLRRALDFWETHVLTGLSPDYTEQDVENGLVDVLALHLDMAGRQPACRTDVSAAGYGRREGTPW
jgi:hypothetical protein